MTWSIQQPANMKSFLIQPWGHHLTNNSASHNQYWQISHGWLRQPACSKNVGKALCCYRQQTLITVSGGETPSCIAVLLVDQPFSSSFQSGQKPHGWNTTRQVRSRGVSFLVPRILTQSGWIMVRILLKEEHSRQHQKDWEEENKQSTL